MQRGAIFDSTGTYRYSLWREWDSHTAKVGFVMLNPSQADAIVDDPTIRRCMGFAQSWQYGGMEVVNLFAYRTAHPRQLHQVSNPIGADNDTYLGSLPQRVDTIILAWGNWGRWQNRDRVVIELFTKQTSLACLGLTKANQPKHPLYIKRYTLPIPFLQPVLAPQE